ncbi:MAG TPA: hypothetical protein VGP32_01435 [Steroidobacteraceae bacterium]|jgi:hypothetical protein|nr:hypothetical protein [Steroidobacteraceae bacterium]
MRTSTIIKTLLAATAVAPLLCQAESTVNTGGASPLTATAHLDFAITIPKFIYVRINSGTGNGSGGWATGGTIDEIVWTLTPASVGTGALAPTAGGDIATGVSTAAVVGNNGNITFGTTTAGTLNDTTGDSISFATISATAAHLSTGTTLPFPGLADGATTNTTLTAVGKVVQQDAKWTWSYSNATVPPQGNYGGINTNNSRVTFTASEL